MGFREKKGFFGRLSERIGDVIMGRAAIDEELFDELEEVLITSDIGMQTTLSIIDTLRDRVKNEYITEPEKVKEKLKEIMIQAVDKGDRQKMSETYPLVIMMIGINGGGKTTTIGKLAAMYKKQGKSVLLAAADTFRAAAAEQLTIWADRVGVGIIKHGEGADPSAVLFDAAQAAKARGVDVLICDTAGRLQNKKNLMDELKKMNRVLGKEFPEADRETLLILDATTGKNAVSQAKEFGDAAELTGVALTKLDGTAKGGIAVTIADEFDLPIKFVGVGEGIDDLEVFDPEAFIGGIFDE
ncbi:MAG TPA: signal recognition particle-docking protein FtsY [Candidatus Eubacterium pullicola]|uniref:Signal recognition particle receptor FtsY n=1 Tax=Gallibacter intestinalis TaxID=2779356 RepID=A0ABR9QWR6_9FIRM|nr:signal recognition particle-docking protein FtsY [Gallibacter intestinalis]MBE5035202.1 signal recognition particle-docking protein FtsY [Gallibacter intestinalis]HIW39451.1 signal recognition particle-docking protein FtsY [Candidatus Eubacterium pullicola]